MARHKKLLKIWQSVFGWSKFEKLFLSSVLIIFTWVIYKEMYTLELELNLHETLRRRGSEKRIVKLSDKVSHHSESHSTRDRASMFLSWWFSYDSRQSFAVVVAFCHLFESIIIKMKAEITIISNEKIYTRSWSVFLV